MPTNPNSAVRWFTGFMVVVILWMTALTVLNVLDRLERDNNLEENRRLNCVQALEVRRGYEKIDREIWTEVSRLTSDGEPSPETAARVAALLEFISEQYEILPTPLTCE